MLKKHLSDILKATFRAYGKYRVGLDAHPENWTVDKKGKIRYVDFEPNSVILDPESAKNYVFFSAKALYLEVGRIVRDSATLKELKEIFIKNAREQVGERFAKELDKELNGVEKSLKKLKVI